MRLRRADPSNPGITRRGRGRGFEYFWPSGEKVTDGDELDRLRALAIPPAWDDVWICVHPNGHLQATGTDAARRRQDRRNDRELVHIQSNPQTHTRRLGEDNVRHGWPSGCTRLWPRSPYHRRTLTREPATREGQPPRVHTD